MKQFTIFNQLTAMPKRLAMVLTMLLTIGIGQALGADTWTLVKDVNDLAVGDEVVIAAKEYNYAMGSQNNNNRASVAITKNVDNITWTGEVQLLTIQAGTTSGTFAFYTGSGYLYAASSSSNYLRTQTTNNANGSWTISITSTGVATIKATGSNTRNLLKFNNGNSPKIFSCYSSGQNDVCIYKKEVASTKTLLSISVSNEQTNYIVGDEFVKPTVTATYSNSTTADVTSSATFSGYNMSSVGKQTVTVSYTEGNTTRTATYNIIVSPAQGGGGSGSGECTWELVTDASTLEVDDEVIIASGGTDAAKDKYALSTNQKSSNRGAAEVTKIGNTLTDPSADVQVLTLKAGATTGTWAFYTGSTGYLYAASSSGNQLKTKTTLDVNGSWTISISNGVASIVAYGSSYRNVMQYNYNNGSPLFACYASASQTSLALYKKVCAEETDCNKFAFSADLNTTYECNIDDNLTLTVDAQYDRKASNNITYQWYSNTTNSTTGGTAIDGATDASYTPITSATGTKYYYCVATYDEECTITSNVATVTIIAPVSTFTVTFDSDGGSAVASQTIEEGNKANKPADPTKNGYEFAGWYNGNTEFDFDTSITGNLALKAKWNIITYNIEYTGLEGATHSNPATYTIETATITFTAPSNREGYVFKGWTPATIAKGSTGNKTVTAQWTPTYTITWLANEYTHYTQTAIEGTALEMPSKPTDGSYSCDDKVFVGWTDTPISEPTDDEPADLFTTKNINVEDAATTYYAVFATADAGGSTTDTYDWESDQTGNWTVDAAITRTQSQGVDESYAGKINTNNTYVTYNNKVAVTNFSFDFKRTSNNENYKVYIETSTDKSTWTAVATYPMTDFGNGSYTSKSHTFDGTQDLYVRFHCYNTTATRYVDNVSITYGGTSYSDYVTTCAVIPDPVWGGAEIDNATISVNCGETSPMNSAAKISFPADKNYDLTYDITVTASYGFLVSTNKTENAAYGTSVTVSPIKEDENAGKITRNVYVRAVAPAMSDVDFTGTITISGKQIETQTIDVTADVTCTGYTLTLIDRGVSTVQPGTYFAGQTIDEDPAAPEGVCTDPIHYVFDGWAEAEVSSDATSYSEVSFPYEVTGNTKFYAVYRYTGDGGEPSNDFVKVTSEKDDWTGDYVIVNEDAEKAIGNAYQNTNTLKAIDVRITDNKVVSPSNDIIWQIRKHGENYTMYNASANKYAYIEKADAQGAGLSATTTNTTQDIQIIFNNGTAKVSGFDIYRCFYYYGTKTEWRTYATGSYNTGALYCRSLESYLYTTSPVCGPHLAITEGKDIYVTGGNAGGTRDLVIAQQKVSYKATRLNVGPTSQVPDVKVATNGITVGGVVTSDVKVTIDQTKEQQTDGTYTITGTITVQYQPSANNKQEDIQVQLAVDYNAEARDNFTIHARSLPSEFVIVAKSGDKWYALNGDMTNGSSANPANGQVTLDDDANPTKATYAPCNTIYTFDGLPNTGDRTRVRFQGTDGAWLWAASGTNVGIQNKSLKEIPEGSNKAYNWKLETDDNITYKFHNDNNSRLLGLNGEKFGMYASGVQEFRILPYVEKCLYNYAPTNLKVSVLKSTSVTLTWDAVAGATKYQYSTDGNTWTDAGTEPTTTISGLTERTDYTYYIRAYHEDAGVSQECIDYAEITFTTADCDDVPTDISFAAGIYSITLYWQCAAETSTVILYSDEAGTQQAIKPITDAKSPLTIDDLDKVTTYYAKILADGTCASPLTTVSTAPPAVDVVEWKTDGMDVYVNTDDEIIVSLEGEVYEGSGSGNVATELFFSKYFEATGNVKLLALFNGTGQDINLSTYSIKFSAKGADYTGATTTEEVKYDNTIELSEDIPDDRLILPAGKELIMISYPKSGADGAVSITNPDGTTIKIDSKDAAILECAANNSQESGWDDYVRVTSPLLNFSGNDAVALFKDDQLVDIIGAGNTTQVNMSKVVDKNTNSSFMDAAGWYNANGYQIQPDGTIGTTNDYPLSTNRCLLIRRNTVINGSNAVAKNTTDFVTLGGQESEWMGYQIPDGNGACEGFEYVGKYDYANYYTTYDKVGEDQTFESGSRNPDGTVPVSIPEIGKYSCKNLKITVKDEEQVLVVQEFKVPIIVAKNQNTDGEVFTALKTTLGTVVIDQNGTPTGEIEPLTDEEWIEECKECDIVVRDNATLTHVTTGLDQFRDLTIYPTGKLSNIESNLAVNRLMIQAENDQVGYAIIEKGGGSITANAIAHTKRIDAQYWYPFSLPYNCNIADITQANGEPLGDYGVHWGIQYYDGERRQESGTSAGIGQSSNFWTPIYDPTEQLNAYQGYLIALFDASVQKPTDMRTIYFPPLVEQMYTESGTDSKETTITSWNVNLSAEKRHHGWNFTGSPYISVFNPQATDLTEDLGLISEVLMKSGYYDPETNEYLYDDNNVYVSVPSPNGAKYYDQYITSATSLKPFTAYFVQAIDPKSGEDETQTLAYAKAGRELPSSAPRRSSSTRQRVLVELDITAPDGQTDNTGVWVDECYTPTYEIAADLTKMYVADSKPQLYTLDSDNEKMAYNAIPDASAENIPLGFYAPVGGNYTLALNNRVSRLQGAETVELLYNDNVVANLFYEDYVITADKGIVNGYSLRIRRRTMVDSAIDNITGQIMHIINEDGILTIEGIATDAQVSVYDMLGRLVAVQSADGKTNISMPIMTQGVYNVVVGNDYGKTTVKVVLK